MSGVGVCADCLTQHMHFPVRGFALCDEGVERPCRRPHDVAARLVVFGVLDRDAGAVDEGAQQPFRDVVRRVVVLAREILLQDVGHDVIKARLHLIFGERIGELGVEHREFGEHFLAEHVPDLELFRVVGDDGASVHLAARAHHGQHAPHGDELAGRLLETDEIFLPGVLAAIRRDGHRLRVVAHRAAAHGKDEIRLARTRALASLVQLLHGGVGHDARVLGDVLAALAEDGGHLVVDAVALDGAAAVDQHHVLAVLSELALEPVQCVLSEIEFGGVAISEITQHIFSPFILLSHSDGARPMPDRNNTNQPRSNSFRRFCTAETCQYVYYCLRSARAKSSENLLL